MPKVWKRLEDGTAPKEAQNGDFVVTNGGTFMVGNKDFHDPKVDTYNYLGEYANAQNLNQPKPATVPNAVKTSATPGTDYSGALAMIYQASQKREGTGAYGGNAYDDKARAAIDRVLGMNYPDWKNSDAYKALAARYAENGRQAMDETVSQIAARTGGLASSYAGVAGQQQYNEYMKQLEDAARQMYAGERSDMIQNASLAKSMGQDMYQRWLQEQSRRGDERETQLRLLQAIAADAADQEDRAFRKEKFEYGKDRDRISDKKEERKLERKDKAKKAELLASKGDYSGYADMLGLTPEEQADFEALFKAAKQKDSDKLQREVADWYAKHGDFGLLEAMDVDTTYAKQELELKLKKLAREAAGKKSGGGGGGGVVNPTEFDWSAIDEMAETKSDGYIKNYLEVNYKKLGFRSAAAAKAAWENHLEDIAGESEADDTGDVGFNDVYGYAKQMIAAGASEADVNDFLAKAKKRGLIGNGDGLRYGFDAYHYGN